MNRLLLAGLARLAPLLPGKDTLAFAGIDSQQKRVYGHAKQGAAFGFTKIQGKGLLVRGLNVLAASICTPLAAPVIAGTRLRGGSASSARGAASMITEAVSTAPAAGCTGTLVVRMDSAFYGAPAVRAARQAGACFSVTVRIDPKVRAARRPGHSRGSHQAESKHGGSDADEQFPHPSLLSLNPPRK